MKHANAIRLTAAAAIVAIASTADAGSRFEKVNMVAEGIDLKPAIVRANSNGYTSYENSSHTYLLRLFAKAKGSNAVYTTAIGSTHQKRVPYEETVFMHSSGKTDGWGVYKKSVKVPIELNKTRWFTSPGAACVSNLKAQMKKGVSKANVLKKEWKVTAKAKIRFDAFADSKVHNRNGRHSGAEVGSRLIAYSVPVVCRAAK